MFYKFIIWLFFDLKSFLWKSRSEWQVSDWLLKIISAGTWQVVHADGKLIYLLRIWLEQIRTTRKTCCLVYNIDFTLPFVCQVVHVTLGGYDRQQNAESCWWPMPQERYDEGIDWLFDFVASRVCFLTVFTLGNNSYGQCGRKIIDDEEYRSDFKSFLRPSGDLTIMSIVWWPISLLP